MTGKRCTLFLSPGRWGKRREGGSLAKETRGGLQPAKMIEMSSCSCRILCELLSSGWSSIAQLQRPFSLLKRPRSFQKNKPIYWLKGDPPRAGLPQTVGQAVHNTKTPSQKDTWENPIYFPWGPGLMQWPGIAFLSLGIKTFYNQLWALWKVQSMGLLCWARSEPGAPLENSHAPGFGPRLPGRFWLCHSLTLWLGEVRYIQYISNI